MERLTLLLTMFDWGTIILAGLGLFITLWLVGVLIVLFADLLEKIGGTKK